MADICWMCEKNLDWRDQEVQKNCNNCGVLNDRTPYLETEPPIKEEEMDSLKDWAKQNGKFVKIKDGESFEGIYTGFKEGVNMNGEPAIIYKFEGKEFKSSSAKLAETFFEIPLNTKVKISRTGEGLQTKWEVTKV